MPNLSFPKIFEIDTLSKVRKEIIIYLIYFTIFWILCFFLFPKIFPLFFEPYLKEVCGKPLIFTNIQEALFIVLKFSFYSALILTFPFIGLHIWRILSENLFEKEKRTLKKLFIISLFLGILAILISYYAIVPFVLKIFLYFGQNFENNLKFGSFLMFFLRITLFTVILFQIPVVFAIFVKEGIITKKMIKGRLTYFILFFYALAVLISPSDFLTQFLLVLTFFLFLYLGFLIAKIL